LGKVLERKKHITPKNGNDMTLVGGKALGRPKWCLKNLIRLSTWSGPAPEPKGWCGHEGMRGEREGGHSTNKWNV